MSDDDTKTAQPVEENEIVDVKDVESETGAENNLNVENPERDEVDHSLDIDATDGRLQTPPTDLPKFPFKFKGRYEPDRRGYNPRDGTQMKSDGSYYPRRDDGSGSYNQSMGYPRHDANYQNHRRPGPDPRTSGGRRLK